LSEQSVTSSLHEYPVAERPLETEPTGIEGSPVEPRLQQFLKVVEAETEAWAAYRETFKAPIPGAAAYAEAEKVEHYLRDIPRAATPLQKFDYGLGPMGLLTTPRERYDPRVRPYLARHLGPKKLYLLQEMVRFGRTPSGPASGSVVLAELFGVKEENLSHEYTCLVTGNRGGMIGAGLGLGGFVRHFIINYKNELGMSYTKDLSAVSGAIFGGAVGEFKVPGKGGHTEGHGEHHETEREVTVDVFERKGEVSTPIFWEPDDFANGVFTVGKVSAEATATVGPLGLGAGAEGKLLEVVTFYHSIHGSLAFNLIEEPIEVTPIKLTPKFKPSIVGGVKAGVEAQFGYVWSADEAKVTAPQVPSPERRETGEWRVLLEAQAFFETGKADVTRETTHTIVSFVDRIHAFKAEHPDYKLRFVVTGHASRRWVHTRGGKTPRDLNEALSRQRAANTLEQIRNVFRNIGAGPVGFELQSGPGPEMSVDDPTLDAMVRAQGPLEAQAEHRAPDDNWWHDRRVDIVVYRNEFAIVTQEPPAIPGTKAE
jgi:outer membrane protein OmpA-like peptidoglycan-associated protein